MAQMKDSGVQWIGNIPSNWRMLCNKYLFYYDGEKVGMNFSIYQLLSLTTNGVREKSIFETGGKIPESYENYQTVKRGQMIFCLFDLDVSAVFSGLSNYDGMITSAYDVYSCSNILNSTYANYFFQYVFSNRYYKMYSKNIRYTLAEDAFYSIKTPVPPMNEQIAISNFLDNKSTEIKSLIDNLNKQIESLKDYKKEIISETVTKGLDPNVPLKDSGIDWIGFIPNTWSIIRLKKVCNIFGRIGYRGYTQADLVNEGEGAITLSPSNFTDGKMNYDKCSYITWSKYYESPEIQIFPGDILYVKTGSTYGKSCFVDEIPCESTINPQIVVLKAIPTNVNSKHLSYIFQSSLIRYQTDVSVVGGTIPTIAQEKINNYFITLPPMNEQIDIANYLDMKCSQIDKLILLKHQTIDKLNEYSKSLIYEYVTGKKEVI